jgi:hypothetical protein
LAVVLSGAGEGEDVLDHQVEVGLGEFVVCGGRIGELEKGRVRTVTSDLTGGTAAR